jgi:hypothetical protein
MTSLPLRGTRVVSLRGRGFEGLFSLYLPEEALTLSLSATDASSLNSDRAFLRRKEVKLSLQASYGSSSNSKL